MPNHVPFIWQQLQKNGKETPQGSFFYGTRIFKVVHPGNAKQVTFFQKVSPVLYQSLLKEFIPLNCLQAMVDIILNSIKK